MGTGMALSMAAMMLPSAGPFLLSYGRDTRRPQAIAAVVLIYVSVWAAIGLALDYMIGRVMVPSSLPVVGTAVAIALVYAITPWGRGARRRCREMSIRARRGLWLRDAMTEGAGYAACCVVCSSGVMLVVLVLGMSNPLVIVAGAAAMLVYKLIPWRRTDFVRPTKPWFSRRDRSALRRY